MPDMNPNDAELMLAVGGMIKPTLVPVAAPLVEWEDFEDPVLGRIWRAIVELIDEGKDPDILNVAKRGASDPEKQTRLAKHISGLMDQVPRLLSLEELARRVRRRATMRKVLSDMRGLAREIKDELESPDGDVVDLSERVGVIAVSAGARAESSLHRVEYRDVGGEISDYFDTLATSANKGHIPTGLYSLDRKLGGGLRPGQLHSILGGTGSGKTSLASQICDEAVKRGFRAIMFSMEVDPLDVYIRDVERAAGASRWDLRSPIDQKREEAMTKLVEAQAGILNREAGKITYGEPMSVEGIRQAVLTEQMRGGKIDLIAVDHAQVAAPSKDESATMPRYLQVKGVAEGLRALARQLKISVVLTAQLNPSPVDRDGSTQRPSKDSVREGKDINNASEVVILIWHQKSQAGEDTIIHGTKLIIDKARAGQEGSVEVRYRGEMFRWEEPEN
jgi:replicative DNA helicase